MHTPLPEVCTTNARLQAQQGALFVDVREALDAQALTLDVPTVHYHPDARAGASLTGAAPRP